MSENSIPRMDIERARKIVSACLKNAYYNMGILDEGEQPPDLAAYTLAEMVEANRLVADDSGETDPETGETRKMIHADDRLIAALYACQHFPAQREESEIEPLARIGHKVLVCVQVEDE